MIALLAFVFLLGAAACSVPLAPGYRSVQQSREVTFIPGSAPEIRVSGHYTFENSGTTDLQSVDVVFPEAETYGRNNLRLEIDGHPARMANLPEEYQRSAPDALRIPFDAVWKRGERREFVIEYSFQAPADSGNRITIAQDNFHLSSRGWTPAPQPPNHWLAPYPGRPDRTSYTVRVPSDFLVLARGKLTGQSRHEAEAEYRYELRKGDLTPFVVAGHYVASAPERKADSPIFWTSKPIQEDLTPSLERIKKVWNLLESDFGPIDKNIHVPHVVEADGLRGHFGGESGPAAAAFPGGVLVNSEALALGVTDERFLERVTHALAHNWFGDEVFFGRYSAVGLGEGLPEYATIVVEQSQKGESGRRLRASQYLREYDDALKGAQETPLGVTTATDPPGEQRIALAKAPLFFVALEDICGEKSMHDGLRQMVTSLRGQEVTYGTLRSALERSSGKNLADAFRVWLNEKGIPADFRARYEGQGVPGSR